MFAGFWTDWLWYDSVGYTSVYRTELLTRSLMFVIFGVLMTLAVGFNIWLAHRLRPPLSAMSMEQQNLDRYRMSIAPYKRWILIGVALLVGLIAGGSASGEWRTWLQWENGTSFGTTDPQFHMDVKFYAFDYPFYRFLLGFGFALVVLSILAAALTHYLYGGLRVTTPGSRITQAATSHLSVLLGLFVALKSVAYWLDRYGLALKSGDFRDAGWTGLRYVDANAYLPAKTILAIIAAICALLFFAALWRRGWQLPVIGLGLMVLSAVLIGGVYPALVQQFQVRPNEQVKEEPYIEKHMDATKNAYDIADAEITDYSGVSDASGDALRAAVPETASIRLLDPDVVSPAFQQIQQVRGYYQFPATLDVDRYPTEDGAEQDTVVGLREMDVNAVPESNWINEHFRYTHGFGMVAASGTEVNPNGEPLFTEEDLPPKGEITDTEDYEPRIYFGEYTTQYSIVGGPQPEIDYAGEEGEVEYRYEGDAGVDLDNYFKRAAFALTMGEPQILYSGAIGDGSQILYNRTPKERVEAVAPWLTIDGDPYPAVVDGSIQWIVDAYTTTSGYPYSSRTTLGEATETSLTESQGEVVAQENQVNYIRNSVKATVDAYTGEVVLYEWDEEDPVLKTWMKAFPGTVEDRSEISDALLDHLRYPQDLFKVQRDLLQRYHVNNAAQFYSGSERWQVPADPTHEGTTSVPPYYLSMRMPDQEEPVFSLTTTFVPLNRQNLASYMAVEADARSPDYGTMRILTLPTATTVWGPEQVQARFNSDTQVANQVNIWQRGDSTVDYGNLLTVPLEGGLLYIEPVYIRGAGQNYPLMQKVLVAYGETIAFEDTLDEALNVVFGLEESDGGEEPPPGEGEEPPPEEGGQPTLDEAVQEAQDAYQDAQDAYAEGDWEAYGDAQQRLEEALDELGQLEEDARREEDPADGSDT